MSSRRIPRIRGAELERRDLELQVARGREGLPSGQSRREKRQSESDQSHPDPAVAGITRMNASTAWIWPP